MTLWDQEGDRMEEYEGFVQEVIERLDADRRVAHLSSDLIKPQLQDWRADHEGEPLPDEVQWEKLALDVYAVDRRHRQGSAQERFRPMCTFRVGDSDPPEMRAYPDVDGLLADEEAIDYYRKRIQETPNAVRRARYADIVYCALARQGGSVYEYGMEAARAYLAQVPLCIEQERYAELVANLDRAAAFAVLFSNKDLAAETVEQVLKALKAVMSERYFSGDFISALHILTPRIEHMLKSALEHVGVSPVAVPNERQFGEQTLGRYLHRLDVQENLGETIWHYLDYALVNERGLNLRNEVAHGWVKSRHCTRIPVQVVLFAILTLNSSSHRGYWS